MIVGFKKVFTSKNMQPPAKMLPADRFSELLPQKEVLLKDIHCCHSGNGNKPSPTLRDRNAPRSGSHFLPTFCWLGQKVGRLAGRDPPVLIFTKAGKTFNFAGPGRPAG